MFLMIASGLPRSVSCFVAVVLCFVLLSKTKAEKINTELRKPEIPIHEKSSNRSIKYQISQREATVLKEVAEFAIRSLGKEKTTFKRILSFKKITRLSSAVLYKLHVLFQRENELLKDKHFKVYVVNKPTRGEAFELKKQRRKERRSTRKEGGRPVCNEVSKGANCSKCGYRGVCVRGTARISPWLQFALKTQREIQLDEPVNRVQFLGAHNAFNNKASGYGIFDNCDWPIKANGLWCIALANQEFSLTDQLNMGVRHLEIDLWSCFGAIHMSHGTSDFKMLGCFPWDEKFSDGIKEISEWTKTPKNRNEIIQLFLDDHTTHKDDREINEVIKRYFGDAVLTPNDLDVKFAGRWPSIKEMRRINKTVILVDPNRSHASEYLHRSFWTDGFSVNGFASHLKTCSANSENTFRVYSDSTHYGPFYNGIKDTGVITDFKKYLLCDVNVPSADQIHPELMNTAIFTWAQNEPKKPITEESCVILSGDKRWYVSDCEEKHHFACVSKTNNYNWTVSLDEEKYSDPACPKNTKFSVPHSGFQHQKLVEAAKGKTVWINLTQYIPFITGKL